MHRWLARRHQTDANALEEHGEKFSMEYHDLGIGEKLLGTSIRTQLHVSKPILAGSIERLKPIVKVGMVRQFAHEYHTPVISPEDLSSPSCHSAQEIPRS